VVPGGAGGAGGSRASTSAGAAGGSSFTFTMANHSSSKHFRYKWPEHPQLKFCPSVGHLHAGQSREVTVTFASAAPVRLDAVDVKVAISQIAYKVCLRWLSGTRLPGAPQLCTHAAPPCPAQGEPLVWDEVVAANMVASGMRCVSATRAATGLPGTGPKPGAEPLVDLVPKTQRDLVLKVRVDAGSLRRGQRPGRCSASDADHARGSMTHCASRVACAAGQRCGGHTTRGVQRACTRHSVQVGVQAGHCCMCVHMHG
jgi:hypothetical protein